MSAGDSLNGHQFDQYTYRHLNDGDVHDNGMSYVEPGQRGVTVHTATGAEAGYLRWDTDTKEIATVRVWPQHQRRGLATELLRQARSLDPDIKHSEEITPEGRAWAAKVR